MTAAASAACPDIQARYSAAAFVVLARVTESSFPAATTTREEKLAVFDATATFTVIRSWKGSFAPGSTISAGPPGVGVSGVWPEPHLFHVGDEVLVFANGRLSAIARPHDFLTWSDECWVMNETNAMGEMAILDTLRVK
jgi:hypothetical protein